MIMKEHVDSNGASPLANLEACRKSLNRCCGREEANVVRQAGSLVNVPGTSWVEGIWSSWRRRKSPASNRVCFNEFGQMNDIHVGQGSKDCSPDLMVSEDQSEHLAPLYPYSNSDAQAVRKLLFYLLPPCPSFRRVQTISVGKPAT